jgi:sec-independent protein translocase protein TatB
VFDVGFWELVVVGVVALLVVGPDRLPELARTAGRWLGRARRVVDTFRADIEREVRADELKRILAKQAEFKDSFEVLEDTRRSLGSAVDQLNAPVGEQTPPPAAPAESPPPPLPRADGEQPPRA